MICQFIIFCSLLSNIVLVVILYFLKNKLETDKKNFYKQLSNKSDMFINTQRKTQIESNSLKKAIDELNDKITSLTKENTGLKIRNSQLEDDSKVFDPEHKDLLKILHTFTNTFNDHIRKYNMHFTNSGECVYYKEAGDHNFYYYDDSEAVGTLINSLNQQNSSDKKSKGLSDNNSSNDKLRIEKVNSDEPDEIDSESRPMEEDIDTSDEDD